MGYRPGSSGGGGGGGSAVTGETITGATTSGSNGTVISKNKTISNPNISARVYLALPSASAAVAYQDYEVKDGAGNADLKPITITTLSGSIDGATEDIIDARWGSKTYYTDNINWFVKDRTTKVVGLRSGGGSYLANFSGSDGAALPTGWSSAETGTGIPWLISTDVFHSAGTDSSSAGADNDPEPTAYGAASAASPANSILSYNAGTVEAGKVISFKWLLDAWVANGLNTLSFEVNGVHQNWAPTDLAWHEQTYTVPSTGTYVFSWNWYRTNAYSSPTMNNGCFIDEFEILDAPVPTYANSFDGVEHAALPAGWSATTTGTWPAGSSGWLHQEGIYYPASTSTSSLGEHWTGTVYGSLLPINSISKLSYAAGTLTAGQVVEFAWMKDFENWNGKVFTFEVNGVIELTFSDSWNSNWKTATWTVPTTGVYTFDWQLETANGWWGQTVAASKANGCFIDEFTIT